MRTKPLIDASHLHGSITGRGTRALEIVLDFLRAHDMDPNKARDTFYSRREWEDRGERYGRGACLVATYEEGHLAFMAMNTPRDIDLADALIVRLSAEDFSIEPINHWSAAIFDETRDD